MTKRAKSLCRWSLFFCFLYLSFIGLRWFAVERTVLGLMSGEQVMRDTFHAIDDFIQRHNALPGDMTDAAKAFPACAGRENLCNPPAATAGNGIIGNPDFFRTLKPQVSQRVNFPPKSAADETVLFWTHLALDGFTQADGGAFIDGGAPKWGSVYPRGILSDTGFIVGYADGSPIPKELSPHSTPIKGTVLLWISGAVMRGEKNMNDAGYQPLAPGWAAAQDRHIDDGKPYNGFVQAYGAPECFAPDGSDLYNEKLDEKVCGLIFNLRWHGVDDSGFRNTK